MRGLATIRGVALRALPVTLLTLAGCVTAQQSVFAGDRLVRLQTPAEVAKGLAAMPRIAAPADSAEEKINAAVARLDVVARKAANECRADNKDNSWDRSVRMPMHGPRYISYVIEDSSFCGGAHPNTSTMSIVYDLTTGRPIDWDKLLPPSLTGKLELATGMDGTRMVVLSGKRLFDLYLKNYRHEASDKTEDAECREAVSTAGFDGKPPAMMAWLDAKAAALVVYFDLVHAVQACAEEVAIPVSVLKAEGAKPALIDAIEAAHRAAPPRP